MKALLTLFAAGMLFAAAVTTSAAAPITWSGNGHSYAFIPNYGLAWEEAQADVELHFGSGWHLATLNSQEEQDWILQNVVGSVVGEFWVGGFQKPSELVADAGWSWITGEGWSFSNFGVGEPNDFFGPGSEQYLALWSPGDWNDLGNGDARYVNGYIAESPAPVPEPGTFALLGVGLAVVGLLKRCR